MSLRSLSMVLRQLGKGSLKYGLTYAACIIEAIVFEQNVLVTESQERIDNIKLSVEKAKEAVSLDVSDGVSWCKLTIWFATNLC